MTRTKCFYFALNFVKLHTSLTLVVIFSKNIEVFCFRFLPSLTEADNVALMLVIIPFSLAVLNFFILETQHFTKYT